MTPGHSRFVGAGVRRGRSAAICTQARRDRWHRRSAALQAWVGVKPNQPLLPVVRRAFPILGHLHRYPIYELKIDKMFVARIGGGDPAALSVLGAIMSMSPGLRLSTVAEGIENDRQRAELAVLGCDYGQGYSLSKPVDEIALRALLQASPVP
ncbi:EAL domain-containing protein [Solwaraspora sp. WMMD406]|uniref:EAL domain-containing protein n=1 Tax=Solwaraspora sp. WMMD406 TaxID=3016095 RepID=UPI002416EA93|nr:EAL domain-containing protein [Solwaraspora sp. WMMD406]MDG4765755.1 EAL domain-containing protein [Solwaraspora sp. WMMD406]